MVTLCITSSVTQRVKYSDTSCVVLRMDLKFIRRSEPSRSLPPSSFHLFLKNWKVPVDEFSSARWSDWYQVCLVSGQLPCDWAWTPHSSTEEIQDDGRKERRRKGGMTATALPRRNYSWVWRHTLVKDVRTVWAAPAGLPEIFSPPAGPKNTTSVSTEHDANHHPLLEPANVLQTFSCCCSSLLSRANTVFVSLFLLIDAWIAFLSFPTDLKTPTWYLLNWHRKTELKATTSWSFLPWDGGLCGQGGSDDAGFLRTVLLVFGPKLVFGL